MWPTLRTTVALSPALAVLILTLAISFVSGHPRDLFLTSSIRGIAARFAMSTLALVLPIWSLPWFIGLTGKVAKNYSWLGELARSTATINTELTKTVVWVLRPVQGISLSLIVAERFLTFPESSTGTLDRAILIRVSLFVVGGALTSVFLSLVWTLDDLGIRFYNVKTGEVHMAGNSIGTILPLITGAIGITSLFHTSLPLDALTDLIEIVIVLYSPYVLFTVIHHEFVMRRKEALSKELVTKQVETKIR
jgi:hypothetical protein